MTVNELIKALQALTAEERELPVALGFDRDGWPIDVELTIKKHAGRTVVRLDHH